MTSMLRISDPYREWLGVEAEERPPGAYALLRLPDFEPSVNKIRQAADQQRNRLERCRRQADGDQWREVSQQLEDAIRTLLEPSLKTELDLAIKRRQVLQNKRLSGSAPIGDESRPVICGGCDQENAAGRRFCAGCGEPLWVECLGCRNVCASNEKFCGICGNNQDDLLADVRRKTQATIDRARSLGGEHRYSEAIAELTPLMEQPHRELRQQVQQAAELIEQLMAARRQHTERAGDQRQAARAALESGRYAEALELLEKVPPILRDEEISNLLLEATQKNDEVRRLKRETAEAIQQKQYPEAAHRIERLLSLTPGDEKVEQVGRNLANQLVQVASKQLSRGQYASCLALLDQIPERYREPGLEKRMESVREIHWLHSTLQRAPYADPLLVEVARRLCADAPKNEQAARLRQRLEERLQTHAEKNNGRLPSPVPWASLPKTSSLDFPLDWETGLQRLRIGADSRAVWASHPGQFYVASGLALHGLGRSCVPLDLKPRKKTGVLGNFSLVGSRKSAPKSAWGLDLGASSLKAVKLTVGDDDDEVIVDKSRWFPVNRQAAFRNDPEAANHALVETLTTFLEQHPIAPDEPVTVNISGLKLLGRFLRLPRLEGKKFQQVLDYEVRHRIPVPIEDLSWGHHVLPSPDEVYGEVPKSVLVIAAKQFEVERRLAVFEQAGIRTDFLQSDATALHNWFQFDRASRSTAETELHGESAFALIDVGSDASQLVVTWADSFWFRVLATGGDDVSRMLVKEFRLTTDQAELLKCHPAKARRLSKMFSCIEPVHVRLRTQLKQSLEAFHQDYPELTIRQGFGVGGGFNLHGMLRSLHPA